MYHRVNYEKKSHFVPFDVTCNNCGSHNVQIIAFEYHDMEIKCNNCGSYVDCGMYNPNTYRNDDDQSY